MPSSPNGPCSTGNTTSPRAVPPAGVTLSGCPSWRQTPSRPISTHRTSCPAASSPSRTAAPEDSDTSCSEERPPASTATVSRSPGAQAAAAAHAIAHPVAGGVGGGVGVVVVVVVVGVVVVVVVWRERAHGDRHGGALARLLLACWALFQDDAHLGLFGGRM